MKNKPTEEQEKDRLVELLAHMILDSYFNGKMEKDIIKYNHSRDGVKAKQNRLDKASKATRNTNRDRQKAKAPK